MIIELATIQDVPALLDLQRKAFGPLCEELDWKDSPVLTESLEYAYKEFARCTTLKVQNQDGIIIGSVYGNVTNGSLYLGRLMVLPEYQQQGIGKQLFREIQSRLPHFRVWLCTCQQVRPPYEFYLREGFKPYKSEVVGPGLTWVYMEKKMIEMNILILSGSPRKGGNTELLAEAFARGVAKHHHVEIVSVRDYKVNPCSGCNACFKTNGICAQKDDMGMIYEKMSQADMLVIASPVYFYGISAQLKTVIDRFHNPIRDSFHITKMALLLVGAATLPELFDAILMEYNLCLKFFGIEDVGKVLVRGVKDKGVINNTDALNEAYRLGESI